MWNKGALSNIWQSHWKFSTKLPVSIQPIWTSKFIMVLFGIKASQTNSCLCRSVPSYFPVFCKNVDGSSEGTTSRSQSGSQLPGQRYKSIPDHPRPPGPWLRQLDMHKCVWVLYVFKQSGLWRTEAGNGALMGILFTVLWAICWSPLTGWHTHTDTHTQSATRSPPLEMPEFIPALRRLCGVL